MSYESQFTNITSESAMRVNIIRKRMENVMEKTEDIKEKVDIDKNDVRLIKTKPHNPKE